MHACLQGRNARVTGSSRQTMHTALIKSDDEAGEFKTSSVGDDDDDDNGDNTCDVL